jgi:hypothetical protein
MRSGITMPRMLRSLAAVTAVAAATVVLPASQASAARTPWRVTIKVDSAEVRVGTKVHITGKVGRAAAGKLVVLQEKGAPDRPWKNQRNALVRRDGTYRTYDEPTVNRARVYRVVMPATKHHKRGVSRSVRVVAYEWQDLTSMPSVNASFMFETSVDMNAHHFPSSLEAYMYDVDLPPSQSVEYNLDHSCTKFRGFFGLSDDSESDGEATVSASADGNAWFSGVFTLGEYTFDSVTWDSPPLKIRFDSTSENTAAIGLGAIGTPEVLCTQ